MTEIFQPVLDAIAAHPEWSGVIIFLIGVFETIVVIGYLLPGSWLMLGYGFLVGTGALRFDVAMLAMTTGGIIGDAIGYWIGRRYGRRIFTLRWFQKHQALVTRSERFFARHGGKAVFLARALGPVRPLVPFFAGLARMNQLKFTIFNIASAILGSLVYLLPGMAVGLGMQFTGAMTWRFVVFILLIAGVIWLCYAGARRALRFFTVTGPTLALRLHEWARDPLRQRSALERGGASLLLPFVDPRHRPSVAMGLLGATSLGAFAGMSVLLADVIDGDPITHVNRAVHTFFEGVRTEWADTLMAAVMGLGDAPVLLPLVGAVLVILLVRRDWAVTGYWVISAAFAYATAVMLEGLAPGAIEAQSSLYSAYPSAHAAIWVILIGYLAILCLPALPAAGWRLVMLFAASVFVGLISFAQLYFGRLVISSLGEGLLLGLGWLLVLTVVTWRHIPWPTLRWGRVLGLSALAVLVTAGSISFALRWGDWVGREPAAGFVRLVTTESWRDGDWRSLPAYRSDFVGHLDEPLNVQAGMPLDRLREAALAAGWRVPPEWGAMQVLALLTAAETGAVRPVLPRFWDGKGEALVLVKPNGPDGRLILRVWESGFWLAPQGTPLYIGTVEEEVIRAAIVFGSLHLPPRAGRFDEAAGILAREVGGAMASRAENPAGVDSATAWRGAVALLAPSSE